MFTPVLLLVTAFCARSGDAAAAPVDSLRFNVRLDPSVRATPAEGRLLVCLVRAESKVGSRSEPADAPFFRDPQPIYGVDVRLEPGAGTDLGDTAAFFPVVPSALPAGKYRAQARFDLVHSSSEWRREEGNLYSHVVEFEIPGTTVVELALDQVVHVEPPRTVKGVEWFEVRSDLLSKFRGHEVVMHAGIALPVDYDQKRKYAAIYEIPGFGGDHREVGAQMRRDKDPTSAKAVLARETFRIVLDPEGPNGHTLFADSANNGPCGAALVRELIPALERRYPLVAQPSARLLRGHSSGGWSSLWLALNYPDVFGATWSSAPDPVDFRRFQRIDIYGGTNFYAQDGVEIPSYRSGGEVLMTTRQENRVEEVLGPENTSAQQWDSWFAAFGPRDAHGHPAALYDPATGVIDPAIAARYQNFDVGALLRSDRERYTPILRQNVHLVVGGADSFYLNEAVELLAHDLAATPAQARAGGSITIVPDLDHGTIFNSAAMRAQPDEMLAHLRAHSHVR